MTPSVPVSCYAGPFTGAYRTNRSAGGRGGRVGPIEEHMGRDLIALERPREREWAGQERVGARAPARAPISLLLLAQRGARRQSVQIQNSRSAQLTTACAAEDVRSTAKPHRDLFGRSRTSEPLRRMRHGCHTGSVSPPANGKGSVNAVAICTIFSPKKSVR